MHRVREEINQLRSQKSNLEISLCDLNKVMVLWTAKLADIREAQSYYQAERSDAGSLALLQAEKHRLQVWSPSSSRSLINKECPSSSNRYKRSS